MIVLTADHGEEFGEHDGFWHGTTLYEEQIHVPLIVKLPGNELGGTRVAWQARTLDVAPTVTAQLGLPAGEGWHGKDLVADVRTDLAETKAHAKELANTQEALAAMESAIGTPEASEDLEVTIEGLRSRLAELKAKVAPCARYAHPLERTVLSEQDFEGNVLSSLRATGSS